MLNYIDRMELPRWYDDNKIALLVVSPNTAYLYWELAFSQCQAVREHQTLLRLFELPATQQHYDQPRLVKNVVLPAYTDNWYFNELLPGSQYRAEIGWEQNGLFFSIIRSNTVNMPHAAPLTPPSQAKWRRSEEHIMNKSTVPAVQPMEKIDELMQQMSFYMGIKEVS